MVGLRHRVDLRRGSRWWVSSGCVGQASSERSLHIWVSFAIGEFNDLCKFLKALERWVCH